MVVYLLDTVCTHVSGSQETTGILGLMVVAAWTFYISVELVCVLPDVVTHTKSNVSTV